MFLPVRLPVSGQVARRAVALAAVRTLVHVTPAHFPDFGIHPGRPLVQDQERVRWFAGSWPDPTGFSAKVVLAC